MKSFDHSSHELELFQELEDDGCAFWDFGKLYLYNPKAEIFNVAAINLNKKIEVRYCKNKKGLTYHGYYKKNVRPLSEVRVLNSWEPINPIVDTDVPEPIAKLVRDGIAYGVRAGDNVNDPTKYYLKAKCCLANGNGRKRVEVRFDKDLDKLIYYADTKGFSSVLVNGLWETVSPIHLAEKTNKKNISDTKITKKKEATTMAYENSNGKRSNNKTSSTMETVKDSLVHGAQVAVADEAGELMLSAAETLLGDAYPALLSTPDGKEIAKGITAVALLYATDTLPGVVPQEENVRVAAGLVLEAVARDVVQPRLKMLQPVLLQLASAGAKAVISSNNKK